MRTFFKEPTCELLPVDSMNAVPVIYKIKEGAEFKLDPTSYLLLSEFLTISDVWKMWNHFIHLIEVN